jgi:hypothetical protein
MKPEILKMELRHIEEISKLEAKIASLEKSLQDILNLIKKIIREY